MNWQSSALRTATSWLLLAVLCAGVAELASLAHVPAGWMLGPMLVALAFALSGRRLAVPNRAFTAAQGVVGVVMAATFQPSELALLADHWIAVVVVSTATLIMSVGVGYITSWITGVERVTSVLGAMPGGASGMVAMSASVRADTRIVALMQYLRLILVVLSAAGATGYLSHAGAAVRHAALVSAHHATWLDYVFTLAICIVGVWGGVRFKVPAGAILGPLVLGSICSGSGLVHITWPPGVSSLAYAAIGIYVGMLFDMPSLKYAGKLLPFLILSTLILIVGCALVGTGLHVFAHTSSLTSVLATSPGGLDSITLMAMGGGADISLVVALQTIRLLVIVLLGPWVVRSIAKAAPPTSSTHISS